MIYVFNIEFLRKDRDLSIRRLSKLSQVSRPHLQNLEKNKKFNPSMDTLSKIADALGVDMKKLFYSELELDSLKKELNRRIEKYGLRSKKVLEISRVVDLLVNLEMHDKSKPKQTQLISRSSKI